jgi:hypothetical protein
MLPVKVRPPAVHLYVLSHRELWRNRFGLVLLVVIPPLFLAIVEWTSGTQVLPIELYFRGETTHILLSQRDISLVFIGAAVSGFLTAYYAILLFHRHFDYYRYCIGMGLAPRDFISARCTFFLTVVVVLALLISVVVGLMTELKNPAGVFLGFMLVGVIYGAYGGLVGLLSKDFMVAVLGVVLLANLDAGWLQNPVFYSTAQESRLIHWLPAFNPTQVVFAAAFTGRLNLWAVALSLVYTALFVAAMLAMVHLRVRSLQRWWKKE